MLVEDELDFADVVKQNLEQLNRDIKISIFNCPTKALTALKNENFSVIISDYHMPEMDGLKFLSHVRDLNIFIPFIIFTGLDEAELEEQSFSAGATYFIKKGHNFKESLFELNKFVNFIFIQQKKALREGGVDNSTKEILNTKSFFNKNEHLDLILQNIEYGIYILDLTGKLVYTNKKGAQDLGYPSTEALLADKSSDIFKILDIYNPKYFDFLTKRFNFKTGQDAFSDEIINLTISGKIVNERHFLKKITPIFERDLSLQFVAITTYDMSNVIKDEYEAHQELQHNFLMNNCLDLLYHIIDEQHFMDSFCKLLVEKGDYILVWIGSAEIHHNQKIVIPISSYGFKTDYLNNIKITWDDTQTAEGPVGTAIKTGKYSLFNDISADSHFSLWRDDALQRGYHSVLSIPLRLHQTPEVQGTLNIYSSKKNAFKDKEIEFLINLSGLLTIGLQILKTGSDLAVDENFNEFPIALIDTNIKYFFDLTNEIKKNLFQEDFRVYVDAHAEIVMQSFRTIKINKINLKAAQLLDNYSKSIENAIEEMFLSQRNLETFKEIIIAINEGKKEIIRKISIKNEGGEEANAMIKLVLGEKSKKPSDNLLVAIIIT